MNYSAASVPDPVIFPINSTEGMELCTEIVLTNVSAVEGEHNFTINISSTSPEITLGDPYEATIIVQGNVFLSECYTHTLVHLSQTHAAYLAGPI